MRRYKQNRQNRYESSTVYWQILTKKEVLRMRVDLYIYVHFVVFVPKCSEIVFSYRNVPKCAEINRDEPRWTEMNRDSNLGSSRFISVHLDWFRHISAHFGTKTRFRNISVRKQQNVHIYTNPRAYVILLSLLIFVNIRYCFRTYSAYSAYISA